MSHGHDEQNEEFVEAETTGADKAPVVDQAEVVDADAVDVDDVHVDDVADVVLSALDGI